MRIVTTGLTLLTLCCAASFAADNWPRFRGPNGTGVSADRNIPVEWVPADIHWKTPIPGTGHSSPIVWDDRIFVQSASADGASRVLLCLDLNDGKVRWTKTVSAVKGKTHKFNSQASSTPATDGERVYTIFWSDDRMNLTACDFQGNEIWSKDFGVAYNKEHGAGHSPVVVGNKVIVNNDQTGGAAVIALDARNGNELWKTPRRAVRTCYSTPFVRERPDGGAEVVVASTAGLAGYDPNSGKLLWEYAWTFKGKALRTVGSPIQVNGVFFASSGDGAGDRDMIAVQSGTHGKAELLWQNTSPLMPYVPTVVARGEHLYYVNDQGTAVCQEMKTGKVVWSERLEGTRGKCFASPVLIDGKVYAVSEAGNVYVFEAKPEFKLLAKNVLGEEVKATPAVAQGRFLVRGGRTLFCVGQSR